VDAALRRDPFLLFLCAIETVIASEAKQSMAAEERWIASSLRSSQ
jgi:hypothetical protein